MPPHVLTCRGLTKRFGDRVAVDDVSFSIDPGETYGLLGPNGAGKTTTISLVCGLLCADAGAVEVGGGPMGPDAAAAKALVGYVPQEIALYPDLSGRENLRFFGRLQGLAGDELDERTNEVLELVGLTDRADDRVEEYSGGMQRRANIAAGLLHRPRLLVLDEPTVGVDPQSRNQILESVEALGGGGLSVLYTTHYMEEAERLCDRIGIIDEGRLVDEGTRTELVARIGGGAHLAIDVDGRATEASTGVEEVPGVTAVAAEGTTVAVSVEDAARSLAPVIEAIGRNGARITGVDVSEADLESVFLALTGKALRD